MTDNKLMTRQELADHFRVTLRTLDRYRAVYDFGEVKVGATIRFRRSAIEAIENLGQAPKKQQKPRRRRR